MVLESYFLPGMVSMHTKKVMAWWMVWIIFCMGPLMGLSAGGQGEEKKEKAAGLENWSSAFDISTKKPGTYNIYAEAQDSAGNKKVAGPINIYVDPASDLPQVSIANPLPRMHVTGDLNIVGTCSDDDGVHEVYVKIDNGEWITAKGKEFWSVYMPAGAIPDGRRKITVKGMDINGLAGPEKTVIFDMDRQKPVITIAAPAEGALLSGKIEIRGIATDANEVVKVEYSIDNGKKYVPAKGNWDRKKGEFSFVAPIDTKVIPSGPTVVLVRATDGCGSVGIKPVIFVVDNKPPVIELVHPKQGEAVDRQVRFMGKVQDDVAVATLTWAIGKDSGEIPLRAGDPYWNVAYTLPDSVQKELELVLTARDTIGNTSSKKYRIPIDRERDLPRISFIQTRPALLSGPSDARKGKGTESRTVRTEGSLFVSGRIQDDDGVKELRYWLNKDSPTVISTTGAFSVELANLAVGTHTLSFQAVDVHGTVGPVTTLTIEDVGPPPTLSIEAVEFGRGGKDSRREPFVPGMELAPDSQASLVVKLSGGYKNESLSYTFGNEKSQSLSVKGNISGQVLVPVPATGPFGVIPLLLEVTDGAGRKGTLKTQLYLTNYGVVRGEPAFDFTDERIDEAGRVVFVPEKDGMPRPLVGRAIGRDLVSVKLVPDSSLCTVRLQDNRVYIEMKGEGVSGPHVVVGIDGRGHEIRSQAFTFVADWQGPSITLEVPANSFVRTPSFVVKGAVEDPAGIVALRYQIRDSRFQVVMEENVPLTAPSQRGNTPRDSGTSPQKVPLALTLPLEKLPDGPYWIQLVARDGGGNVSSRGIGLYKDTEGPQIELISPTGAVSLPVVAGIVRDPAGLAELSYRVDEGPFQSFPAVEVFALPLQVLAEDVPHQVRIRAVDRAGNETVLTVSNEVLRALRQGQGTLPAPEGSGAADGKAGSAKGAVPRFQILYPSGTVGNRTILLFTVESGAPLSGVNWAVGNKKGALTAEDLLVVRENLYAGVVVLETAQGKAGPLPIQVSGKDTTGKSGSATAQVTFDPSIEKPLLSLYSIEADESSRGTGVSQNGTPSAGPSLVALATSSFGIASYKVTINKESPQTIETPGFVELPLANLAAGSHSITVVATDLSGKETDQARQTLQRRGTPPLMQELAVVAKNSRVLLDGADALPLDSGMVLEGLVRAPEGLSKVEVTVQEGPPLRGTIKKTSSGDFTFQVPVPGNLPFDRTVWNILLTDEKGNTARRIVSLYRIFPVPNPRQFDGEGIYGEDPRIDAEKATLRFTDERPLVLRFVGRPIQQVRFEPATDLLSVEYTGSLVTLTPRKNGTYRGNLVVKTIDGDDIPWGVKDYVLAFQSPVVQIQQPQEDGWYRSDIPLLFEYDQSERVKKITWSFDGERWQEISLLPEKANPRRYGGNLPLTEVATLGGAAASFLPSGTGTITVWFRLENDVGRFAEFSRTINIDTEAPQVVPILPPSTDTVNGTITTAVTVSDSGLVARIEYSPDGGTSWQVMDTVAYGVGSFDVSAKGASPDKAQYRVTDRAGNVTLYKGNFLVDVGQDKPIVLIQLPAEQEIIRNDFTISGAVFDDDGLAAIHYRFDTGPFVRLPLEGNGFVIPVALADTTDNEHTVEIFGEDIYGVTSDPVKRTYRISKEEPRATVLSPSLDTTVRGIVTIKGSASDANGIATVELSFDNALTFNQVRGTTEWTYRLDTRILKDGLHSLYVRPTDNYETTGFFAGLISVDNTPPELSLDVPVDMKTYRGKIPLSGRVSDNQELMSCEVYLFNKTAPETHQKKVSLPLDPIISMEIDTGNLPAGEYGLRITATDKAGNQTTVSRDIQVDPSYFDEQIAIATPVRGERLSGKLRVQGFIRSNRIPSGVSLYVDGLDVITVAPNSLGWFAIDVPTDQIKSGTHTLVVRYINQEGATISSEEVPIEWLRSGPWLQAKAFASGDYVPGRPWLEGTAGWFVHPQDLEQEEADDQALATRLAQETPPQKVDVKKLARERAQGRQVLAVEVSLDNGRSFLPAQGTDRWKFRLQTQEYPEGPLPLVIRARFKNGDMAVSKLLLNLDKTAPEIKMLFPVEGGRYNEKLPVYGIASDDVQLSSVQVVFRRGDKAGYEVPAFIQGLYIDGGYMGESLYNVGLGLTFFDNNVKLQGTFGYIPQTYMGEEQRFYGNVYSGKLLANVAALPFSYFFGPDWNFLSAHVALGAKFSYFTETSSGTPLMLSAVVGQLEFPHFTFEKWSYFSNFSLYTEFQAWFISAEVEGGIKTRLSFGARTSVF